MTFKEFFYSTLEGRKRLISDDDLLAASEMYEKGEASIDQLADRFNVNPQTIKNGLKQLGSYKPGPRGRPANPNKAPKVVGTPRGSYKKIPLDVLKKAGEEYQSGLKSSKKLAAELGIDYRTLETQFRDILKIKTIKNRDGSNVVTPDTHKKPLGNDSILKLLGLLQTGSRIRSIHAPKHPALDKKIVKTIDHPLKPQDGFNASIIQTLTKKSWIDKS